MRRGQVSVETLAIFAGLFFILVIVFFNVFNTYQDHRETIQTGETRVAAATLQETINNLCRLPRGSKRTAAVNLPGIYDADNSFIGSKTGSPGTVIGLHIQTDQTNETVTRVVACNATGTLPANSGKYQFQFKREPTQVLVNWTVIS